MLIPLYDDRFLHVDSQRVALSPLPLRMNGKCAGSFHMIDRRSFRDAVGDISRAICERDEDALDLVRQRSRAVMKCQRLLCSGPAMTSKSSQPSSTA